MHRWTEESIGRLPAGELEQLRENARRLGAADVVALCEAALGRCDSRRAPAAPRAAARKSRLIPRRAAFQLHEVPMGVGMASWSGLRRSDGGVVFALWAEDVRSEGGGCCYLLWAPNEQGARPWSDSAAGKERREHCLRAMENGSADGFLVFGTRAEGFLPQERAHTITGVEPDVSITLRVEQRGAAYWGVWGARTEGRRL